MARGRGVEVNLFGLGILLLGLVTGRCAAQTAICVPSQNSACVTTWHNDNGRTGQNLNEGNLLYNNLSTFGQLCSVELDGQVYAQPLVLTGVPWGTLGTPNVAYVVTMNDTLYAINGTPPGSNTCQVLGSMPFLNSGPTKGQQAVPCGLVGNGKCGAINPSVGILGTPVINVSSDHSSATMYLVTYTCSPCGQQNFMLYHYLHALDISGSNITEKSGSPVLICANACGGQSASAFSATHIQRPGLLYLTTSQQFGLQSDMVYVAFSMMDDTSTPWPNGWIFGYNASNLSQTTPPPLQLSTSQGKFGSDGGGFWMGGAGPAWGLDKSGGNGYIYANTANGTWDGLSNWGDSFLKLDPTTLNEVDYFTPSDFAYRDCNDFDIGSGGVMLIPNDEDSGTYFAVLGEKESGLWFIDRANPGKCTTSQNGSCLGGYSCPQSTQDCTAMPTNPMVYWTNSTQTACNVNGMHVSKENWLIHNTPAYWEPGGTNLKNYLYVAPTGTATTPLPLYQYTLCTNGQNPPVCGTAHTPSSAAAFPYGSTPSISQSPTDDSDGIVWAIATDFANPESTNPSTLYAFHALDVSNQLYTSSTCKTRDNITAATKFSVPTVANGYVYVGAEDLTCGPPCSNNGLGTFHIFGLHSGACQ
jgi:hypothetical protein